MKRSSPLPCRTLALFALGFVTQGAQATAQTMTTGGPLAGYGASVAVSDGAVFVGEIGNIMRPGAVYVYHEAGGHWSEAARMEASDATPADGFGAALAVDDGTMLVAANGAEDGSVYAFLQTEPGQWREVGRLLPDSTASPSGFGTSLAIKGGTAVVGSPGTATKSPSDNKEAVFVFEFAAGTFSMGERLVAGQANPDSDRAWRSRGTGSS